MKVSVVEATVAQLTNSLRAEDYCATDDERSRVQDYLRRMQEVIDFAQERNISIGLPNNTHIAKELGISRRIVGTERRAFNRERRG